MYVHGEVPVLGDHWAKGRKKVVQNRTFLLLAWARGHVTVQGSTTGMAQITAHWGAALGKRVCPDRFNNKNMHYERGKALRPIQ